MTTFETDLDDLANSLHAAFDEAGCTCEYICSVIWQRSTVENPGYRIQHAPECPILTEPAQPEVVEPAPEPAETAAVAPEPEPEPEPEPKKPTKRAPRKKAAKDDESETS